MQRVNIVWFRRDLRLEDNQAFFEASQSGDPVLPIFIVDPWFYSWAEVGLLRVCFMFESLQNIHQNLITLHSQLVILEGDSVNTLENLQKILIQNNYQPHLYFNRDAQTEFGKKRDELVVRNWNLIQPHSTQLGQAYFLLQDEQMMEYWRNQYYAYQQTELYPKPRHVRTDLTLRNTALQLPHVSLSELKSKYHHFAERQSELFYGGETTAHFVLRSFLDSRFSGYHWKLSRPYLAQLGSTSQLSPHLMFGTISPRQVYQQTKQKISTLDSNKNPKSKFSLNTFLDRLRWRDSFTQRFWFHPEYAWKNRFYEFDYLHQINSVLTEQEQEFLVRWQHGETGFPLIDASMRQLKAQGWMNFRMRAMCATFFTINCKLPWQIGARYFMNNLVDGDMCINAWQWQMQSGITNPLSPTFRIYNPTKNILEKDANLKYIHFWIPELRNYSLDQVMNAEYVNTSTYPKPMLDFNQTRKINGKVVSDMRKKVRTRLNHEQGIELDNAKTAQRVVLKYKEGTQKRFRKLKSQIQPSLFDEGNV